MNEMNKKNRHHFTPVQIIKFHISPVFLYIIISSLNLVITLHQVPLKLIIIPQVQ